MKVAITGGTGFVGKALTKVLLQNGNEVYILTRNIPESKQSGVHYIKWLGKEDKPELDLEGVDVFVNLAGASLNSGRWTEARKELIFNSRIYATREIVRIISNLKVKPTTLINASAVGFYGTSRTESFTEDTMTHAHDFLGEVVWSWEEEARGVDVFGTRVVCTRFGLILDKDEGALPKIVLPYKLFVGGTIGSGKQWLSWIHIDDVIGMILFSIKNSEISGPLNVVAPHPVIMREFGEKVGKALRKPHWLPVPSIALKTLLGEMSILVLEGQRVLPMKAEQYGYKFLYYYVDEALQNILKLE